MKPRGFKSNPRLQVFVPVTSFCSCEATRDAASSQNPRVQVFALAATVAAFEAKLASIPGIPESVQATVFLADGGPLIAPNLM